MIVDTTVQVWMGLTMGCAKCHSHKYDPISHAEYYGFYALFNQTEDADLYTDVPVLELLTPKEQDERKYWQEHLQKLNRKLTELEDVASKASESGARQWHRGCVPTSIRAGPAARPPSPRPPSPRRSAAP